MVYLGSYWHGVSSVALIPPSFADQGSYPLFNAFLPQYLSQVDPNKAPEPVSTVYRNYAIISIVGCPGSVLAYWAVDTKLGRKGSMAIGTYLTSIFLVLFVTSTDDNFQLAFNCLIAFL